jgi:hypothetical protein
LSENPPVPVSYSRWPSECHSSNDAWFSVEVNSLQYGEADWIIGRIKNQKFDGIDGSANNPDAIPAAKLFLLISSVAPTVSLNSNRDRDG